ncbi:hypothetical protein BDF22DRAFT_744338 [Syncephalis plumigaleata]|nr:hypothetical protein BDF22DRAFT_744338 [Syncephalis plumigaleata]
MPVSTNLTVQFQDALQQIYQKKVELPSADDSATTTGAQSNTPASLRQRTKEMSAKGTTEWQHLFTNIKRNTSNSTRNWQPDRDKMDSFMLESYRVADHIQSLQQLLITSRRAYLARVSSTNTSSNRMYHGSGGQTTMTEAEREEIDRQAKDIIRGCAERIAKLEQTVKDTAPSMSTMLARQLSPPEAACEQQIRAHRGAITWWLNKRLADVSSMQREQQELRLRREIERQRSSLQTQKAWSTTASQVKKASATGASTELFEDQRMVEKTLNLTPEQHQLLENENRELAQSLESTLDQVRDAERAILEIAELQNQLMSHVAAQAKETEDFTRKPWPPPTEYVRVIYN